MRNDSKIKPEMVDIILRFYKTKTRQEIAEILGNGVTAQNVQSWLKRRNLFVKKDMFSDDDIEFMKSHYQDMSYKDIGIKLGFTERQVRGKINNMGLSKIRRFNDRYFQNIDSSNKAYYLGLIYADGWIICDEKVGTYELGLQLQSQDKYILEKLNQELGGVHNIVHTPSKVKIIKGVQTISKEQDTLRVYSKQLVDDLIALNIVPNKTKSSLYPIIPNDYFFDFLRGYIDGDGCYYINRNGNCEITITCAQYQPLEWILSVLQQMNICTSVYQEYDTKYRLYCFRKTDVKNLLNKLYYNDNGFCLIRKFNKIKPYLDGFAA